MPDLAYWLCGAFAAGLALYDFAYRRGARAGRAAGYHRGHLDGVRAATPPPPPPAPVYVDVLLNTSGWSNRGGRRGPLPPADFASVVMEPDER